MHISKMKVEEALCAEDIEDLISSGAPEDEYSKEAECIVKALNSLSHDEINVQTYTATIAMIWAKSFNRSPEEIKERMPAFRSVAINILKA